MVQHVGLLTDFGTRAGYVSSMKGVIISICDSCSIDDLSHEIAPQNVMEAALFLENCCEYFPRGFIFLAIVDPGVGTSRRMLCLRTRSRGQIFIAPDNGLLDLVMKAQGVDLLVSLENKRYWRETTSCTFHGRDIMGPVAAHVAAGVNIADLGPTIDPSSVVKLVLPLASHVDDAGNISGAVLYIDQFGNVITNVQQNLLENAGVQLDDMLEIRFPGRFKGVHPSIRAPFKRTYADVGEGEFLSLLNSENRFEIAANRDSASAKLGLSGGEHSIEIRNVKRHGAT
jgi:S-adenosyl-L-methionine hydrolase (adenosine-forming)